MVFVYEKLEVWQEAVGFAKDIYQVSKEFPTQEQFSLTIQSRRAAVSISCNIAEGKGRYHKKEFMQFLYVARGSLYETLTLLHISTDLDLVDKGNLVTLRDSGTKISLMINSLINSLKK